MYCWGFFWTSVRVRVKSHPLTFAASCDNRTKTVKISTNASITVLNINDTLQNEAVRNEHDLCRTVRQIMTLAYMLGRSFGSLSKYFVFEH